MNKLFELGHKLHYLALDHSQWSQATFGTDQERGPIGPLKHLEKEAKEVQNSPKDITEYADCFLLILDAARRGGISPEQLIDAAQDKLNVNKNRKWPKHNEWVIEKPHFIDSEDCMGHRETYWRVWAQLGEKVIAGFGTTAEQAVDDAKIKIKNQPVEHIP